MKIELIQPFINAADAVLAETLQCATRIGDVTMDEEAYRRKGIASMVTIKGDIEGRIIFDIDTPTAARVASYLTGSPVPESDEVAATFFPPKFKEALKREPPAAASEFASYAAQLKRDVAEFRVHLDQLAQKYPNVAQRISEFKRDFGKRVEPPPQPVKPLTAYSRGHVLGLKEEYYQIGEYAVIREGREMRIIGIRFFSRLF